MLETGKITCEASLASYNKHKNRFPNILACKYKCKICTDIVNSMVSMNEWMKF